MDVSWRLHADCVKSFAGLDFAIVGLAQAGGLPQWISDLRTEQISEVMERKWCERYASSHVVIGVHGSNMLLPSAHTGAVVELMPAARWGNMLQDFLFNRGDTRETLFRCRVLPLSTSPADLADSVSSLLMDFNNCFITMEPTFCKHGTTPDVRKWAVAWQRHLERVRRISSSGLNHMCGIAGIVAARDLSSELTSRVTLMNDALIHRGPDGSGSFQTDHIAFAMRRLSIIDLAHGAQPLYNEDRSLVTCCQRRNLQFCRTPGRIEGKGRIPFDSAAIVKPYFTSMKNMAPSA